MRKNNLSESLISEIIHLYVDEFCGSPTISEKLKIKKHIVLKVLKENNIAVGRSGRKFKGGKNMSDKRYYEKNRDKRLLYFSIWQKNNLEYRREYIKRYRKENGDKIRKIKRDYERNRKAVDPQYKLISNFRTAIYTVLKEHDISKNNHYFEILGYSQHDLILHLESLFLPGMSWDNYGEWHVDHKKPITKFKFKDVIDNDFIKCWALDNLQPMWGTDNIRKSNKTQE